MFPEGGGRGIKKCVGGEQIFSEVASKNHHRNLKYFSFLLSKKKKKRSKNLPHFSCHVLQHTKFYNTRC